MARKFKPIELREFKEKVEKLFDHFNEEYEWLGKVNQDLGKVKYDYENITSPSDTEGFFSYPAGYRTLDNGMNFLFANAGGDWETPVCFIIYWDGKSLRGYIPTEGNCFNKKTKMSYGNENSSDESPDEDVLEAMVSEEKMIEDIKSRILPA